MNRTRIDAVALLSLLLASPLAAQSARELRGQIFHLGENGERISEPGLIVILVETGATDDTNDQGIFRLPLPPAFQPGDPVTISIDKPGWRIRFPLDGEARIPRDLLREIVPVELLQVGSKLFWTHDRIEKFIRDASERSKQEGRREDDAPSLDLGREIKDWAAKYGFSAQEAREEIDRWIADVEAVHEDSYQKGLASFAKQQFDTAAERFRDSAEWRIRQLDETRKQQEKLAERAERLQEEVVRDLRLEGDSHYYAYRFEQALTVYEQAHQYTSKDQTPRLWGATLNDIGRAHRELGIRMMAGESSAHLAAAAQAYRQTFLVYTREQLPQDWAMTQNNLGAVLTQQGMRTEGAEGAQLLAQAVQAYEQALLVRTRDQMPQEWAMTQSGLGHALQTQGVRSLGAEGAQPLAQAVQAYRQALLVMTREQLPREWAMTQDNLGIALRVQGRHTAGDEGIQLLAEAVQAHRQALLVETREQMPQQWAATQSNLGDTLQEQGGRTAGKEGSQLLAEAVQAFRQALLVRTREQLPQQWATTQNNLGNALQEQGRRTSGEAGERLLVQAIDAYRQALLVFTPDHLSRWWATARSNEAEVQLALHRYEEAAEAVSQVLAEELDASTRIVALGYAIAAGLAMGSADVSDRVEELLGVVAAQPQDFRIVSWTFEATLRSLGGDPEVPHKDLLIRLFQALEAPDRDSLLQGLRAVKEAIVPENLSAGLGELKNPG